MISLFPAKESNKAALFPKIGNKSSFNFEKQKYGR